MHLQDWPSVGLLLHGCNTVKIWKCFPWARRVSAPTQPTVLPIIQQLKDTNCLYDTGRSAWCSVMTWKAGVGVGRKDSSRGRGHGYVYSWLWCGRGQHNIVKQLSSNLKQFFKKTQIWYSKETPKSSWSGASHCIRSDGSLFLSIELLNIFVSIPVSTSENRVSSGSATNQLRLSRKKSRKEWWVCLLWVTLSCNPLYPSPSFS